MIDEEVSKGNSQNDGSVILTGRQIVSLKKIKVSGETLVGGDPYINKLENISKAVRMSNGSWLTKKVNNVV